MELVSSDPMYSKMPRVSTQVFGNKLTNIVIEEKLGSGNFGEVYRGLWDKATPVALKKMKSGQFFAQFEHEARLLL